MIKFLLLSFIFNIASATTLCEKFVSIKTEAKIISQTGADPWMIRWKDGYLYSGATNESGSKILITFTNSIEGLGKAKPTTVFEPTKGSEIGNEIWAPEIHRFKDRWIIYFTAGEGPNHRMYAIQSKTSDPLGEYELKGKLVTPDDHWAIDGTVLETNGKHYFIWSGWEGTTNEKQCLYISRMANPWTLEGERVKISEPEFEWEKKGSGNGWSAVNEGPQILKSPDGKINIIYSASGSWTDDYCLGQLTLKGEDVMNPKSWVKKDKPVFSRTDKVYGPGHASFLKDKDGEHKIIYHAAKHSGSAWERNIRVQTFKWNLDGTPNFGEPLPITGN